MNGNLKKYPMKEIMQILPGKPGGRREKTVPECGKRDLTAGREAGHEFLDCLTKRTGLW
ncbi:hypothetical protein [Pseudoflavonifractor capillosus]|uniref:hypothetical protein n=1 Tax=Pseudoflavonifractor capillosus TaxID=106588 RepID=UPI001959A362|nr:hypothetical protein [Pseudoflavonifractor capillosus]